MKFFSCRYRVFSSVLLIPLLIFVMAGAVNAGNFLTKEVGFDRPGSDYKDFDLASPDPNLCKAACFGDFQCSAYTYVNPGVQGPNARCWLKDAAPQRNTNGCCTSGTKVSIVNNLNFTVELNRDRMGQDYKDFDLVAPSVGMCIQACKAESQCAAFTFVAPGVQGPNARCWLKNSVPAISASNCCVSGKRLP